MIRRFPCGRPVPFRTVRDLGRIAVGRPGTSGESGSRSSVWLPTWLPVVLDVRRVGVLVLVITAAPVENFPAPYMACCEHRVHQVVERRRFSRPEGDGSCRDEFECFNQPHDRPGWVLEAVDQDCPPLTEATAREFSAVGHSAAIIRVRRQNLLGCRVLVVTVVTPETCDLDFNGPVGQLPQSKVALLPASRVASLPRAGVDATANGPQLGQRQCYSFRLPEWTNARLIEPSGGTAARCLGAPFVSGFHTSSEVMNDLPKLHGSQGMGGRVGLEARSDLLVTRLPRRCGG